MICCTVSKVLMSVYQMHLKPVKSKFHNLVHPLYESVLLILLALRRGVSRIVRALKIGIVFFSIHYFLKESWATYDILTFI